MADLSLAEAPRQPRKLEKGQVYLEYRRCPAHGYTAISVGTGESGHRLTSSKCCGRWDLVKRFRVDALDTINAIREEAESVE